MRPLPARPTPNPTEQVYDPIQGCRWNAPICRVCRMHLHDWDDLTFGYCKKHEAEGRAEREKAWR